jgi:chromosome partitioning protein
VLNEADAQGRDNQEAVDSLRDIEGLEIAPVLIGRRKAFPNAASAGPSVLEWHNPKAIDEFGGLVSHLYRLHHNDIGVASNGYR